MDFFIYRMRSCGAYLCGSPVGIQSSTGQNYLAVCDAKHDAGATSTQSICCSPPSSPPLPCSSENHTPSYPSSAQPLPSSYPATTQLHPSYPGSAAPVGTYPPQGVTINQVG